MNLLKLLSQDSNNMKFSFIKAQTLRIDNTTKLGKYGVCKYKINKPFLLIFMMEALIDK